MTRFTSLADHKFRIFGLLISVVAIILLVTLHLLNYQYEEGWHDRIFIINHFIIVFGLYMIMFSKEIHDDERVQRILTGYLKKQQEVNMLFIICFFPCYS
jgi:hypothetical protein